MQRLAQVLSAAIIPSFVIIPIWQTSREFAGLRGALRPVVCVPDPSTLQSLLQRCLGTKQVVRLVVLIARVGEEREQLPLQRVGIPRTGLPPHPLLQLDLRLQTTNPAKSTPASTCVLLCDLG